MDKPATNSANFNPAAEMPMDEQMPNLQAFAVT
jgi:hypothetical protein